MRRRITQNHWKQMEQTMNEKKKRNQREQWMKVGPESICLHIQYFEDMDLLSVVYFLSALFSFLFATYKLSPLFLLSVVCNLIYLIIIKRIYCARCSSYGALCQCVNSLP